MNLNSLNLKIYYLIGLIITNIGKIPLNKRILLVFKLSLFVFNLVKLKVQIIISKQMPENDIKYRTHSCNNNNKYNIIIAFCCKNLANAG